jgi:hypothetical protein
MITLIALAILLPSGSAFAWRGYGGFGAFIAPPLLLPPPPFYYPGYYGYREYYGPPSYYGYGPGYYYNDPYRVWVPGHWESRWTPYGWQRVWIPGYWQYGP